MTQDGIELAEMLRRTLQKEKIILVGHSWGSILGVFMAKARPDLFSAFVGTGQVADPARNYAVAYDALLEKATTLGDARAVRELIDVGPPPSAGRPGPGYAVQRKWSNFFEGADFFIASMVGFALTAPGYTPRDINDWFRRAEFECPAPCSANERTGSEGTRWRLRSARVRYPRRRGLHHADESRQNLRPIHPCAAQSIRGDTRRRPLRRVHETERLSPRTRRESESEDKRRGSSRMARLTEPSVMSSLLRSFFSTC
jgi:pimeloyl-ACP methyl ester carboxylesterase